MDQDSITAVMDRLEPYFGDLDAIARAGHTLYQGYDPRYLIEHSSRTAANCIYDHMVAEAERRFEGRGGVMPFVIKQLKLWMFDELTTIRWKKMGEDGSTANYPTRQAKAYDQNLPLDGLPPEPTRVTVGYVLNKDGTAIERVQVARPNGAKRIDWCAALNVAVDGKTWTWEEVTKQARF